MTKAGKEVSSFLAPTTSQQQAAEQELSRLTAPSKNRLRERKVNKMGGDTACKEETASKP